MAKKLKPLIAAKRGDAARYRFLREGSSVYGPYVSADIAGRLGYTPEGLDEACDAGIRACAALAKRRKDAAGK